MISKEMYRFLKRLPRWPRNKSIPEIEKTPFMDKYLRLGLMIEAKQRNLIGCNGKEEDNSAGFYLAESGQEAIEEYKRQIGADRKATWALIISALSLLASVAAIIISCIV